MEKSRQDRNLTCSWSKYFIMRNTALQIHQQHQCAESVDFDADGVSFRIASAALARAVAKARSVFLPRGGRARRPRRASCEVPPSIAPPEEIISTSGGGNSSPASCAQWLICGASGVRRVGAVLGWTGQRRRSVPGHPPGTTMVRNFNQLYRWGDKDTRRKGPKEI